MITPSRTRLAAAAAVIAMPLLAGCGGNRQPPATAASPTAAATTASPTPSPTPAATLAPSSLAVTGIYAFGKRVAAGDGLVDATVFGYKQPVAKDAPRPSRQTGYEWGAADVRVCAAAAAPPGIYVTNGPWRLVYVDDTLAEASNIGYNQFPNPGYPFGEHQLAPGRCVRGWITFPVPKGKKPAFVEYGPEAESAPPRWTVK